MTGVIFPPALIGMHLPAICGVFLIGLFGPVSIVQGQSAPAPSAAGAERAVADFYAWYVRIWPNDPGPDMRAVRERRGQFGAPLVKALRADSVATAQGGEDITGLDADPFLNAHDPCEHYRTIGTVRRGDDFLVAVLGEGGCRSHSTPDVIVQVAWRDNHAVFVNFLYSRKRGDDLLFLLKQFEVQRRKDARMFQ